MSIERSAAIITAIIPTYRRPQLLRRAISSVLRQEDACLTVGIFDNASGDGTREMVIDMSRTDSRVRYHCHETNIGAASNFEFGMHSVVTPFFSILSDDDYLLPGFYKRALHDLAENPEAMFWAGLTLNVDEIGKIWDARVGRWPREGLFRPSDGLLSMMHGLAPAWTGIVFRREILDRLGLPDKETLGPSDLDFVLRAAASYPFILRKIPVAVFTLNPESFSATQPLSSFWPGWQKMFANLAGVSGLEPETKAAALAALHQDARRMLFRRGANALSFKRYDFARDAARALQTQYHETGRPLLLKILTAACERLPWLQHAYTRMYRRIERRIVSSRTDLESRFGNLVDRSSISGRSQTQ